MRKKKEALKEECETRGLSSEGTKRKMIERIMLDEEVTHPSHQRKE